MELTDNQLAIATSEGGKIKMNYNSDFVGLIEYAIKAPSGHNAQPWRFVVRDGGVEIRPDFKRKLPVCDPYDRELYISIGCALQNLLLAAGEKGYSHLCKFCKDDEGALYVDLDLEKGEIVKSSLFKQVSKRQTNRSVYDGLVLPSNAIKMVQQLTLEEGVNIRFYQKGTKEFDVLAEFVAKGNEYQLSDKRYRRELISWMRVNDNEVQKNRDGLSYKCIKTPSLPSSLGRLFLKMAINSDSQTKRDMRRISSSSHLVLFSIDRDTPERWISLGRSLQNFLLKITGYEISHSYFNQPCEIAQLAELVRVRLALSFEIPAIILRIGYGGDVPYSRRRDIMEMVEIR